MTREEARKIYRLGEEAVVDLILKLEARIQRLENILAKDSHNSSKPPSSDGPKKTKSMRKPSGKNPGGQNGHNGSTLNMVDNPNHTQIHRLEGRCDCGRLLKQIEPVGYEKRQVFDLPEIKIEVTEHCSEIKICDCGAKHVADFPDGVTSPVQYGNRLKSSAVYLMNYQHLPYDRTCEAIRDLFHQEISPGTLFNFNKSCYNQLEKTSEIIKEQIINSTVVHFDETGSWANNEKHWLHTASTEQFTYYNCHRRRGKIAMDESGILPNFDGTAVHDYWKSYMAYSCKHALCGAHHLRNLQYVFEQYHQSWAEDMQKLLCEIKEKVEIEKEFNDHLDQQMINDFETRYQQILTAGYQANPPPEHLTKKKKRGKPKRGEPLNLLDRFKNLPKEVLAFMYDFNVPFDNNLAERDIRMMKLHQKISGIFRSKQGADMFCRIRGFISTVRKHNMNVINAICTALETNIPFHFVQPE